MKRTRFSLIASTAMLSVMATQGVAQQRSDGASDVTNLMTPSYSADTSLGLVTGDNLGNHIATTDLNMDGLQIFNIGNPTNSMDAVNLQTLQDYVAANGDNLGDHKATQSLDMNGFQITGVGTPSSNSMAANKSYVDTRADAAKDNLGNHVATQNLDMSGHRVTGLANPSAKTDGVNLDTLETYVAANGDNLGDHVATQNIDLDGNALKNVAAPSAPGDGSNKQYVDDAIAAMTTYVDGVSSVTITGGTGLTGGGDLTQNRVISFDTAWGDGRYALQSRTINAGTGMSGGGSLSANRTLSFNTSWGDGRYVNQSGNETISGIKTFASAPRSSNSPVLGQDLANKTYVDAAAAAAVGTLYSAGTGLVLDASNTFGIDDTVLADRGAVGNVSLDTLKVPGTYNMIYANRGSYTAANHFPAPSNTGVLEVATTMMGNGQERVVQRFTGASGDVYVRSFDPNLTYAAHTFYSGSTNWSPWVLSGRASGGDGIQSTVAKVNHGTFETYDQTVAVDGTVVRTSGDQSIGGNKTVTGRLRINAAPSWSTDVTNKAYVDAAAAAATGTTYSAGSGLNLSGTTFAVDGSVLRTSGDQSIAGTKTVTGRLRVNATPAGSTDVANKAYVDAAAAAATGTTYSAGSGLNLSGTSFSVDGTVLRTTGSQGVSGLKTFVTAPKVTVAPTAVDDVVNKAYADTKYGQGRDISTSENFDSIVENGFHRVSQGVSTGTANFLNRPTGQPGMLEIMNFNNSIMQRYSPINAYGMYYRTRTSSGIWSSWVNFGGTGSLTAGDGLNLASDTMSVDNTVVRTSGNQSISGAKTFSSTVTGPTFNATSTSGGGFQGIGGDSASAPSFTWSGDLDTGMYRPGTNMVGLTAGSAVPFYVTQTAAVMQETGYALDGFDIRNAGNRVLTFSDNSANTEAFVYHNDGDSSLRTVLRSASNPNVTVAELRFYQNGDIAAMGGSRFAGDGSGLTNLNLPARRAQDSADGFVGYQGSNASDPGYFNGRTNGAGRPTDTTYRLNYNGQLWASTMYSSAYYYHSDARLKKDVETIGGAEGMGIVNQIRPVNYAWINNGKAAHGVIAQEVEKVYPEIVSTNSDGYKSVDYIQMIAPMLAAIQELDKRVGALEDAR